MQCFRTVPYAHEDAAALLLLGQVLSTCFLHREIREKGGAYGGGASYSPLGGIFSMTSYRDPRTLETLETFAEGCNWAANRWVWFASQISVISATPSAQVFTGTMLRLMLESEVISR